MCGVGAHIGLGKIGVADIVAYIKFYLLFYKVVGNTPAVGKHIKLIVVAIHTVYTGVFAKPVFIVRVPPRYAVVSYDAVV